MTDQPRPRHTRSHLLGAALATLWTIVAMLVAFTAGLIILVGILEVFR
jgi:hypothetical protein